MSDHNLHIDLISSNRTLVFLRKLDSGSLPGRTGGVRSLPPLLPATAPRLLGAFFLPEGEDSGDSGDSGVEGPLKEANLPLILRMMEDDR